MGCLSLCHAELSLPTQKKLEKANFFSESPLSENEIRRSGNDFAISGNEVGTVPTSVTKSSNKLFNIQSSK